MVTQRLEKGEAFLFEAERDRLSEIGWDDLANGCTMVLHGPAWVYPLERGRGRVAITDVLACFVNRDVQ